jgi:HEAT repeat protein
VSEDVRRGVDRVYDLRRNRDVDGLVRELARGGEVRGVAIWALWKVGDERAVPALARLLSDDHPTTRLHAAIALGRIGHPNAIPALRASLGDPLEVVREVATFELTVRGFLRDPRAAFRRMETIVASEQNFREHALTALARCGDRSVTVAFVELLDHEYWPARRWALKRLRGLHDPAAVETLAGARRREPLHRRRLYSRAIREIQRGSSSARP